MALKDFISKRRNEMHAAVNSGQAHVVFAGAVEDFESYSLGSVSTELGVEDRVNGWASPWTIHAYTPKAEDDLATYSVGANAAPMGSATGGWSAGWNAEDLP